MRSKARGAPWSLKLAAVAAILFLHVPLAVVVLYAFTTDDSTFRFPLPGLTTRWFGVAWGRPDVWAALFLSVKVALVATLVAVLLGSLAAAAVYRSRFFGRDAISFLLVLPLAVDRPGGGLTQIEAGAKPPPLPLDDQDANPRVRTDLAQGGLQLHGHPLVDRVQHRRPVKHQMADLALALAAQRVALHDVAPRPAASHRSVPAALAAVSLSGAGGWRRMPTEAPRLPAAFGRG